MKKVNEGSPAQIPAPEAEEDNLLPHYDFSGGVRGKHAHWFYEGARIEVNGIMCVVTGRRLVPEPDVKPRGSDNRGQQKK